jgi:SAM-dependent methyltransferase
LTDAKLETDLHAYMEESATEPRSIGSGKIREVDAQPSLVIRCPVCQSLCRKHTNYNLTACPQCRHIYQTDLNVTVSYDAEYAHQYDTRPVKAMSELRWNFIRSCLELPTGSRILDVGYGNGAFLKRARDAEMSVFGIDLHTEDFGIPVVSFDTPLSYDVACFFDSLEHFPSFAPIFRLQTRHVVVSIPNTPDFVLTAPQRWRHFKPGEHLHYFSRDSLDALMRTWGFPKRLAEGYPEDDLRGKLKIDGRTFDNIYTAIYTRA